jgi:hypothetical protein
LRLRGGRASDHPESVATTLALSFAKIEQASPAAAELLRFFAFLHPDDIFEELIQRGASQLGTLLQTAVTDTFTLNETIGELHNSSMKPAIICMNRDNTQKLNRFLYKP